MTATGGQAFVLPGQVGARKLVTVDRDATLPQAEKHAISSLPLSWKQGCFGAVDATCSTLEQSWAGMARFLQFFV